METWTPAGKIKFPSFVSSWTIRLRTIIGGYSLKTSYKIMVTCDMEYIYIVRIRKWCAYQTHLIKYLIEVMPMQKNWLQWRLFCLEKIHPSQWLNIWITHLGTYYNNFTYVSLPSQNTENAQETLQNTENTPETYRVKLDWKPQNLWGLNCNPIF